MSDDEERPKRSRAQFHDIQKCTGEDDDYTLFEMHEKFRKVVRMAARPVTKEQQVANYIELLTFKAARLFERLEGEQWLKHEGPPLLDAAGHVLRYTITMEDMMRWMETESGVGEQRQRRLLQKLRKCNQGSHSLSKFWLGRKHRRGVAEIVDKLMKPVENESKKEETMRYDDIISALEGCFHSHTWYHVTWVPTNTQ